MLPKLGSESFNLAELKPVAAYANICCFTRSLDDVYRTATARTRTLGATQVAQSYAGSFNASTPQQIVTSRPCHSLSEISTGTCSPPLRILANTSFPSTSTWKAAQELFALLSKASKTSTHSSDDSGGRPTLKESRPRPFGIGCSFIAGRFTSSSAPTTLR